jgi:formiminotetrahydrofolate cyclodeaminase
MGAALVSMVCNLTIGNKKHQDIEGDMKQVLARAEDLRHKLTDMIDDAAKTLDSVVAAYRMAKDTDEEKATRSDAIQTALTQATEVSLRCCKAAREMIDLGAFASEKGNRNASSDGVVGVLAAYAALKGAALKVYANSKMISDNAYVEAKRRELEEILAGAEWATNRTYASVGGR